jgi:hypothetical protein
MSGLLKVALGESPDTLLKVKAVSDDDPGVSAAVTVTVAATDRPVVTGITITPSSITISRGGTQEFTPNVAVLNNAAQTVIWSVERAGAEETEITQEGILFVALAETASSLLVRAVSTENPDVSGAAEVIIDPIALGDIGSPINTLTNESEDHLVPGRTYRFEPALTGAALDSLRWFVENNRSPETYFDGRGRLTVGADETVEALRVMVETAEEPKKSSVKVFEVRPVLIPGIVSIQTGQDISPGDIIFTPQQGTYNASFAAGGPGGYARYRWVIDDAVRADWDTGTETFAVPAASLENGVHWISLQVETNRGVYYSASKSFTVQK